MSLPTADQLAARRARVAAGLDRPLLVTTLVNVRYLSGFTGSNGTLLLRPDGTGVLWTDGRYKDQAAAEVPDLDVVVTRSPFPEVAQLGGDRGILVETHTLSVDDHAALAELDLDLASAGKAVENARLVKDDAELDALRTACSISVDALEQVLAGPLVGRSERQVARDLEQRMLDLGAEAIGFETIVATGPESAVPHHHPTDRVVERGDLLKIDFGARVDGYHADCTRTVVLGPAADWQREIHAAVREAQALGVAALRTDASPAEVDQAVRANLAATGQLEHFTTGLGHGVGLVIHEDPFFGPTVTSRLEPRTVLTMEPGIYLVGRGGVRIEDTVCVTSGDPDVLTPAPTDLLEIA